MRKGTLYVSFYRNNRIFDILDEEANRDDGRRFYYDLRQNFLANGFDLSTQDLNPGEQSEFVIYHDMPKPRHLESPGKSYLLLMEPPTVKPRGWAPKNHKYFKRIFTYHDAFVNTDTNTSGKYVKVNYAQNFSFEPTFEIGQRPKLCATIVGNKTSKHPYELYNLRLKVAKWFQDHHPDEFDLYGTGWEGFEFQEPGFFAKILKKRTPMSIYRGAVEAKHATLQQYRFAISFENCQKVDGYISEKIFDCFVAGTVPIYMGAPNVADHIPKNCFLDFRDFGSMEEMYGRISQMPLAELIDYQQNIRSFLSGPQIEPFRSAKVADDVVKAILSDLN